MKSLRLLTRPAAGLPRTAVILSTGFFFVFMGASAFQQFLIPYLTDKGVTSAFQASTILALVYISFLVWRAVVAYTLYYLGEYWSTVLGATTYSLFALAAFTLNRFELLLIAAGMWGWGAAAMWISSTTQLLDATAATHYGRASGLLYTATTGGQAIGVLLLGLLMSVTRVEFGPPVAAAITGIGVAAFLFLPYQHTKRVKPRLAPVFQVLTVPRTGLAALFLFLSSLAFGLILGSFSQIIGSGQGHGMLALITAGYWIVRIFGSYAGGFIADWLGREQVLILSFGIAGLGLLLPTFSGGTVTMSIAALAMGLLNSTVPVATNAMIGDLTTFSNRHLAIASLFVWRDLGVGIAILAGAAIISLIGSEQLIFGVFGVAFLVSAGFAYWLKGQPIVKMN